MAAGDRAADHVHLALVRRRVQAGGGDSRVRRAADPCRTDEPRQSLDRRRVIRVGALQRGDDASDVHARGADRSGRRGRAEAGNPGRREHGGRPTQPHSSSTPDLPGGLMSGLAPQWAFSRQAIDGAGHSPLAPGIPVRLLVSQLLGLPIRPFAVSRISLGQGAMNTPGGIRTDVTWTDSHGVTLVAPFTVSAGNPVTGWLPGPAQGVCCWIEVMASPAAGSTLKVDAVVNTDRGPAAVATAA